MILTSDCADALNTIINLPDIRPYHLGDGEIDVQPLLDEGGFGVIGDGFGFLLHPVALGVFEVHTSILPAYRKRSREITLAGMDMVFTQTTCAEIVTRVKENKPARRLATSVGMQKLYERDGFEFLSIPISRWASQCDRFVAESTDDPLRDQFMGVINEMMGYQPQKAEWLFDFWVRLSGEPIAHTEKQSCQ